MAGEILSNAVVVEDTAGATGEDHIVGPRVDVVGGEVPALGDNAER